MLQGVEVMHGGIVNVLHVHADELGLQHGDRTLLNLNFYFDASALDIWLPLSRGCSIVIIPGDAGKGPCCSLPSHRAVQRRGICHSASTAAGGVLHQAWLP